MLSFADQIRAIGFTYSQLEIDDRWETCYGELYFGPIIKFPDPKQMNSQLQSGINFPRYKLEITV